MPTNPLNTRTLTGSVLVPPDGYILTFSGPDGYYIPRPPALNALSGGAISSPYNATTEDAVLVPTHAGTFTVNLPINPPTGKAMYVKDFAGVAAANNINVVAAALIDTASPYVINTAFGAVKVVFNGTTWSILSKF